jgi:hypothetical protein
VASPHAAIVSVRRQFDFEPDLRDVVLEARRWRRCLFVFVVFALVVCVELWAGLVVVVLVAVVAVAFTGAAGFAEVAAVLAKAAVERAAERRTAERAVVVFMVSASWLSLASPGISMIPVLSGGA